MKKKGAMGMDEGTNWDWVRALDRTKDPIRRYPLQLADCARLDENDAVYIFDEVGCGKTITAGLMALHYLFNNYKDLDKKVLVITTPALERGGWDGEFLGKWRDKLPFGYLHLTGRIHITNDHHTNIRNVGAYGLVIIDEAHRFLKTENERYQALAESYRSRVRRGDRVETEKVVFLTATPIKNGFGDLRRYHELASIMLPGKELSDAWIDEIEEGQKAGLPICARFDQKAPVTRYFKSIWNALKDGPVREIPHYPKRRPPILWEWGKGQSKQEALLCAIREALKKNGKSRFLVFVKYVEGKSGARYLREYLTGHKEPLSDACDGSVRFFEDREVAAVTGQYRCDPPCEKADYSGDTSLAMYGKRGEEASQLPKVLIVTYPIAGEGVDLPGFDHVVDHHIPSYPAALEQRFGRIDRDQSEFDEIHTCYLLKEGIPDTDTVNFHHAVGICLEDLMCYLPARNALLSSEVIERHFTMDKMLRDFESKTRAVLDDGDKLWSVYQAFQRHLEHEAVPEEGRWGDIIEFCCEDEDLSAWEGGSAKKFRRAVLAALTKVRDECRCGPKLQKCLEERKGLLAPPEDDRITYIANVDESDVSKVGCKSISVQECLDGICRDSRRRFHDFCRELSDVSRPLGGSDEDTVETYRDWLSKMLVESFINSKDDYHGYMCWAVEDHPIAQYQRDMYRYKTWNENKGAASLFKSAAEQGYAPAQYMYGHCLAEPEAVSWWEKSAGQGYVPARYELVDHYRSVDLDKAMEHFRQIPEQVYHEWRYDVMRDLARSLEERGREGDGAQAFDLYKAVFEDHAHQRGYVCLMESKKALMAEGQALFECAVQQWAGSKFLDWALFELARLYTGPGPQADGETVPPRHSGSWPKCVGDSFQGMVRCFKRGIGTRRDLESIDELCWSLGISRMRLGAVRDRYQREADGV